MASNEVEAIKRALRASGGKTDAPAVQQAYNTYVNSMAASGQKAKDISSFK